MPQWAVQSMALNYKDTSTNFSKNNQSIESRWCSTLIRLPITHPSLRVSFQVTSFHKNTHIRFLAFQYFTSFRMFGFLCYKYLIYLTSFLIILIWPAIEKGLQKVRFRGICQSHLRSQIIKRPQKRGYYLRAPSWNVTRLGIHNKSPHPGTPTPKFLPPEGVAFRLPSSLFFNLIHYFFFHLISSTSLRWKRLARFPKVEYSSFPLSLYLSLTFPPSAFFHLMITSSHDPMQPPEQQNK